MLGLLAAVLVVAPTLCSARSVAAEPDDSASETIAALTAELDEDSGGALTVSIDPETDHVSLLGSTDGAALTEPTDAAPATIATDFVEEFGAMFGAESGLEVERIDAGVAGTRSVRFQQHVGGVPVLAGEIAVLVDAQGQVVSAAGESIEDVVIDVEPAVAASEAARLALALSVELDTTDPSLLSVSDPELWIYDPQVVGAADVSAPRLVWRMTVTTSSGDVERLVLVDAHDASIALHVSTREDAGPGRSVCNNANIPSRPETCTTPVRTEGSPPTGNAEVDSAYALAGVTYDFYKNVLGRNGIDGDDLPIASTVNYCTSARPCPYGNAFWNGDQMVYGTGYASADDVVAHELTHGVTQYTSNLFYYAESGAINESIADVFGELIDQSDTTSGADPFADKWLIGEQLAGDPLRDMRTPANFGDPDRMRSQFFNGSKVDSHSVHQNSGVGNKAAFLITDGGSFNGQTIVGLGITKTAKIYYQAQTTLLGPGSDYLDLYGALQQACSSLIPAAVTTSFDCQQVTRAVTATEMNLAPVSPGARLTAAVCDAGTIAGETLFGDDMEAGLGKWVTTASHPTALWTSFAGSSQSGSRSMHGPDVEAGTAANRSITSNVRIANALTIPAGKTYLRFDHSFDLEANANSTEWYDGGIVEYSTSGATGPWVDAGATLPTVNGYTGTLPANNVLGARPAFTGTSPGYQTTRIDLSSLAGQSNVLFRFRIGTDEFAGAEGWFIDDVGVYRCGAGAPPGAPMSATVSVADGTATLNWTPPASAGFPALNGYVITPYADGVAQPAITVGGQSTTYMLSVTPGVTYTFTVAAQNTQGIGPSVTATGRYFSPVGPARLFDTRPDQSPTARRAVAKVKVGPDNVLEVQVSNLAGLTPANGVGAVSLNVTATGAAVPGFVTVYPCGRRSQVSTVNFDAGDTVANATITPVSAGGTICLFASTPVDLVVDINGWFALSPGYNAVGPARVLDTRPGESPGALRAVASTKVGGSNVLQVQVADLGGLTPASGVAAVSLNVTATGAGVPGFVTVYPCGTRPSVSNVNFDAGQTVANATITPVSASGSICLFANTPVDLVVDINGWFSAVPGFAPAGPARVLDTRSGQSPNALRDVVKTPVGGGNVLQVKVSDMAGITPASGVGAVSLNVTATGATVAGFVTVYPCGALGQVSNVNFEAGSSVANAVITPVSSTGAICIFASTPVNVIVDINGWFTT